MNPVIIIGILEAILGDPKVQDGIRKIIEDAVQKIEEHIDSHPPASS